MSELLTSTQFWLGAILLLCFQIGKYSELNEEDEDLKRWLGVVPSLRARDFLPFRSYLGNLILFLLVTFTGYLVACLASPSLIAGWHHVTNGTEDAESLEKYISSVPYSLFIAAAFMGLTHQAIPGFSKIANLQRNIFHELVGIPGVVAHTATDYSIQLWANLASDPARIAFLNDLTGAGWRKKLRVYSDINFFDAETSRRMNALSNLSTMSQNELKALLEQIIYILSIAAVRQGGGAALRQLAGDLQVVAPTPHSVPVRGLVGFALMSTLALTVMWFGIPLLAPVIDRLNGSQPLEFWPHGADALEVTGLYLIAQVVPILMAATILMILISPALVPDQGGNTFRGIIENYSFTLLLIAVAVFAFDYAQIISDYGIYSSEIKATPLAFFRTWAPYNMLHAAISLVVCIVLLNYIVRGEPRTPGVSLGYVVATLACAMVFSLFYAVARLHFDFKKPIAADYILIICLLNTIAAAIALYLSQCICHRRLLKSQSRAALPPPQAIPTAPRVVKFPD